MCSIECGFGTLFSSTNNVLLRACVQRNILQVSGSLAIAGVFVVLVELFFTTAL